MTPGQMKNDPRSVDQDSQLLSGRFRSCLLGGAVGDALGAPVEFLSLAEIRRRLGPDGVAGMVDGDWPAGSITDDTQMTLFTAEGLLRAMVRQGLEGVCDLPSVVDQAYARWLRTQGGSSRRWGRGREADEGWLMGVSELHARRAPGMTCLSALQGERMGTPEDPLNNSKGCGGVMRVGPVGLVADGGDAFCLGAQVGALTHGHPSGYLSAGFLASLIASLRDGSALDVALDQVGSELRTWPGHEETLAAVTSARQLADSGGPSPERLESLGGGWVGEEALAIAVYAVLTGESFPAAVLLAVNHGGDSDSTGAIAGNIAGLLHGLGAIPEEWLERLELRAEITGMADDLHRGYQGPPDWDPWRKWERYPGVSAVVRANLGIIRTQRRKGVEGGVDLAGDDELEIATGDDLDGHFEVEEAAEGLQDGVLDQRVAGQAPQFHQMYRELLDALAEQEEMSVPELTNAIGARMALDENVMQLRLASGRFVVRNRVHWAATSLLKADLIELIGPSTYRILPAGRDLLETEERIDGDLLLQIRPSYARWHEDMGITKARGRSVERGSTVWMVRAGRGGALATDFLRLSAVVVGWGETGDVSGLSRDVVAERVKTAFPDRGPRQRGQATNTLLHLLSTMEDGDLVVTPEPASRTLVLGRVSGAYRYLQEPVAGEHAHAREVTWFGRASRDEVSYGARKSLGSLLTLSRPNFATELLRLAEDHRTDPSPQPLEGPTRSFRAPEPEWPRVSISPDAVVASRGALAEFPIFSQPLMQMLDQLHAGQIGLPDFQRSFVWAPDATRELIVSIIRGFPAGNLLFLRGGSKKFKTRAAEEAPVLRQEPSFLILDGQQRLTSLYQALFGLGSHRFFLDVGSLLGGSEVDESVRHLPAERVGALAEVEAQAAALMLPLSRVRAGETYRWINEVVRARNDDDPDRVLSLLYDVQQAYVEPLLRYSFPVTQLPESTELEAVCTIFETLNRTGRPLTTFELISARAFAGGLSLRDLWNEAVDQHSILGDFAVDPVYLLQVIALREGSQCKRSVILRLSTEVIEREWDSAVRDTASALHMLRAQCGVLSSTWLPYSRC
ncbi:MAG: ADP-ribosylglycohydrolase family protein [Solirubrobacteraceae bacterium]